MPMLQGLTAVLQAAAGDWSGPLVECSGGLQGVNLHTTPLHFIVIGRVDSLSDCYATRSEFMLQMDGWLAGQQ